MFICPLVINPRLNQVTGYKTVYKKYKFYSSIHIYIVWNFIIHCICRHKSRIFCRANEVTLQVSTMFVLQELTYIL